MRYLSPLRIGICLVLWIVSLAASSQHDRFSVAFRQAGFPQYGVRRATILPDGNNIFPDIFTHVSQAQRSIHVEFYKLWNDSIGCAFLNHLAEKAEQGVEVRVIYDDFGNKGKKSGCTPEFIEYYRNRGVQLEAFDPFRFPYANHAIHRDHRKMIIIDDTICYTGGLNVADYYLKGRPELGAWRDMFIRMEGSVAYGYQTLFTNMWKRTTGQVLNCDTLLYNKDDEEPVFIASREPGKQSHYMRLAYRTAIDSARHHITIVNPYPLHRATVRKALYRALKRGVRVQYMVSYTSDHGFMTDMVGVEMYRLAKRGAEVYLYRGGFHHDKVIIVDDTLASVGTANMDARSMSFDWEVSPFLVSPSTARDLQQIFDRDIPDSYLLTPQNYKQLYRVRQRIRGTIMRPLIFML